MEKTCHASEKEGSLKAFIECLKKHIDPSIDVLEAMNDVESMLPKSSITTAIIIVKAFIEHFMLPVAIMALDMIFDIILVREYYGIDQDCLTAQYMACIDSVHQENQTITGCNLPVNQTLPRYACIPLKLDIKPR